MSPRNNNILTVQDWSNPKRGKLYRGIVKKTDPDKKAQCIHVAIENLDRTQLGRVHEINLPLPIRPSIYHKTCSFLSACGIDASVDGVKICLDDTINTIIGIRFGAIAQDGSQQIDFEKIKDTSSTPETIDRRRILPLKQDDDRLDQNHCQTQ